MKKKMFRITGWTLSIMLGLIFAFSAAMKLTASAETIAQAGSMGLSPGWFRFIGILELASLVLFLIPRTAMIGTLLLIAYMGGAIATHVEHNQPAMVAIAVQVLLWVAAALRIPRLRAGLLLKKSTEPLQ
jgi:hypothetical protein